MSGGRPVRISILGDSRDAVTAFDKAGAAAKDADRKFDGAAEGADTVASKGAQAAGALSGLGDLIGGKFGAAMVVGGTAMQAAADAGDLLNVAIEGGAKVAGKAVGFVKSLGKAETYVAGAKKVSAAAQWALNAAMSANPAVLITLAIIALVAAFVIAYKKSEKFRAIVQGAMKGVLAAGRWVASFFTEKVPAAFGAVVSWVKKNWPKLLAILTGPIGLAVLVITKNWDKIKAGAGKAKDWIVDKFNGLVDWFRGLPSRVTGAVSGLWDGITNGFRDAINKVIGWWNGLSFSFPGFNKGPIHIPGFTISTPDLPYIGGGGSSSRTVSRGSSLAGLVGTSSSAGTVSVSLKLTGPQLSALQRGREIEADRAVYLGAGGQAAG